MSKKQLVIQHDLSKLTAEELEQYKRDVSEFIGLDPDLNALDTIWMHNENGPGQSLIIYARRGTAEILRNKLSIEVSSLVNQMVKGSIVFTATGKAGNRQEMAIGSKCIEGLQGKALDDAIMTASTRALRRLTMQFTSLGILDESEVSAIKGDTTNLAAGAALSGSAVVIPPPPTVLANNAPGKDITPVSESKIVETTAIDHASGTVTPEAPAPVSETQAKPKRSRRPRNMVNMEGPEPEVVSTPTPAPESAPTPAPVPLPAPVAASVASFQPPPSASAAVLPLDFPGKPNEAQMADYRKRVSVYTSELPSSENMGSVQKMRAFITRQTGGIAPQFMSVSQWETTLGWFEQFVEKNKIKGLIGYINDSLSVK